VANERPVTGSCERCARGHDLLIPEPGSGDLDFQRIVARFGWCAGCDRVVGRTCCWDVSAGLCPDCAALRAAQEPSLTDAVLTRNALFGLSAATESLNSLGRRLRRLPVTDEERARNGWEDAWLEAGVLIVRADSAADTAHGRGAAASVTPSDEQWLTDQLATRGAAWDKHDRAVADRLERVGLRIHALGALALPVATPAAPPPERQLVPVPVTRTLSPVTHLPVREPASVGARAPARTPSGVPAPPAVAPRPPARRPSSTQPDGRIRRDAAVARQVAIPPAAPPQPSPSPRSRPAQPVPPAQRVVVVQRAVPVRPAEPPHRASAPQPGRPVLPRPVARPQPAPRPSAASSGGPWAVALLVALLTVIGAVVVVMAAIDRLGGAAEPSSGAVAGAPSPRDSGANAGTSPSPSADATAAAAPGATAAVVTFDLEPLGRLSAEAAGIARVVGAPEVAAVPTPTDRSLRLAAPGSGACLVGVPGEAARSLAIDLRAGTRPEGSLRVTPTDRPEQGVAIDLALIAGLEPETWYGVRLDWADDGAITLEVREHDGGRSVHRGRLTAATDATEFPGSGAVCLETLRVSEATAMHIDNARVGS
jgi:hypothetical protein